MRLKSFQRPIRIEYCTARIDYFQCPARGPDPVLPTAFQPIRHSRTGWRTCAAAPPPPAGGGESLRRIVPNHRCKMRWIRPLEPTESGDFRGSAQGESPPSGRMWRKGHNVNECKSSVFLRGFHYFLVLHPKRDMVTTMDETRTRPKGAEPGGSPVAGGSDLGIPRGQ